MKNFRFYTPFSASGSSVQLLERASDSKKGRTYRGVSIVKVGRGNKEDNNYYPAKTLKEGVDTGMFEGLRAFADHPTAVDEQILPERSIRDIVGVYTNTRFKENQVVGDLTIFGKDAWLSSMIDELLRLNQADKIGISINGAGKTVPKSVSVSESGEQQEVNWLESFHVLRSADVVTEAGAGGGFQRILESARAARGKAKMKLTKDQQAKLQEVTATGDMEAIDKLMREFTEANKTGGATPKKDSKAKPGDKPKKPAVEAEDPGDEDVQESDPDADDPGDEDEVDHDAELEAAADEIKEDSGDEDDDVEDDPDEEDEEDDDDVEESTNTKMKQSLLSGAKAIRAAAARAKDAKEKKALESDADQLEEAAAIKVAGGSKAKTASGGKGNLSGTVKGTNKVPGQRKPKMARESDSGNVDALRRQLAESEARNTRLSKQLSIRQNADRAKKLLKESAIPSALRPKILPELVGLTEDGMRRKIEYHESFATALLETVREDMFGDDDDDQEFDRIEGAGSRVLRESGDSGSDLGEDFFAEVGLPLKK